MQNVNTLLLAYAALVFSTVFGLSLLSEERIDVYIALFAVELFIAAELTRPFTITQNRKIGIVGILMLILFTGIVVERIIGILW